MFWEERELLIGNMEFKDYYYSGDEEEFKSDSLRASASLKRALTFMKKGFTKERETRLRNMVIFFRNLFLKEAILSHICEKFDQNDKNMLFPYVNDEIINSDGYGLIGNEKTFDFYKEKIKEGVDYDG